ncbi:hypothetical protein [Marinobacter sp. CHS3-4]|nr:hypothetical protein [Marinobacter sp. CHS3-4]MDI9245967.1 hypothetical protein [Marinobacter sp. CHS3-4]
MAGLISYKSLKHILSVCRQMILNCRASPGARYRAKTGVGQAL